MGITKKTYYFSGNKNLLGNIKIVNRKNAKEISTFDFSTLYIRPIIVNYSFIVTHPHRKNLPQNAA